jgi:hypothetical protein
MDGHPGYSIHHRPAAWQLAGHRIAEPLKSAEGAAPPPARCQDEKTRSVADAMCPTANRCSLIKAP